MDVLELIKKRRSCRSYKPDPVPSDVVEEIIEAGIWAPSAMNRQDWKFVVLDDREKVRQAAGSALKLVKKNLPSYTPRDLPDPIFYSAPVVIMITMPEENTWAASDSALAAENMMLYSRAQGIGSCFIGLAKFLNDNQHMLKKIGVPERYRIYATLVFGYPKEWPKQVERKEPGEYTI
ncbi:nitroreductase family protein [Candidatus Woesearchaeota archaeon]|nr:nitroreductase family protein [Candidatus Woesearchaeota archaeon]